METNAKQETKFVSINSSAAIQRTGNRFGFGSVHWNWIQHTVRDTIESKYLTCPVSVVLYQCPVLLKVLPGSWGVCVCGLGSPGSPQGTCRLLCSFKILKVVIAMKLEVRL